MSLHLHTLHKIAQFPRSVTKIMHTLLLPTPIHPSQPQQNIIVNVHNNTFFSMKYLHTQPHLIGIYSPQVLFLPYHNIRAAYIPLVLWVQGEKCCAMNIRHISFKT